MAARALHSAEWSIRSSARSPPPNDHDRDPTLIARLSIEILTTFARHIIERSMILVRLLGRRSALAALNRSGVGLSEPL
jgi:hypothetical protein